MASDRNTDLVLSQQEFPSNHDELKTRFYISKCLQQPQYSLRLHLSFTGVGVAMLQIHVFTLSSFRPPLCQESWQDLCSVTPTSPWQGSWNWVGSNVPSNP